MRPEGYLLLYCRNCGRSLCVFKDSDMYQRKQRQGYPLCPYCKVRCTGVWTHSSSWDWDWLPEIREPAVLRKPISKEIRKTVLERDGYTCLMCGSTEHLQLDHITPVYDDGETSIENLQTLCRSCNARKGPHGTFLTYYSKLRRTQWKYWGPETEQPLAMRLIQTLNKRGFTNKDIAERTGLPQQSVTKLANKGQGRYETVKAIEQLAIKAMPELKALIRFIEESNAETVALVQ